MRDRGRAVLALLAILVVLTIGLWYDINLLFPELLPRQLQIQPDPVTEPISPVRPEPLIRLPWNPYSR